jgi:hypothetical protein
MRGQDLSIFYVFLWQARYKLIKCRKGNRVYKKRGAVPAGGISPPVTAGWAVSFVRKIAGLRNPRFCGAKTQSLKMARMPSFKGQTAERFGPRKG